MGNSIHYFSIFYNNNNKNTYICTECGVNTDLENQNHLEDCLVYEKWNFEINVPICEECQVRIDNGIIIHKQGCSKISTSICTF
jgi:hypothetical protein